MKDLEVIEETKEYTIFTANYLDTIQRFRRWNITELIEIAFTDDFCRANGYRNRADMLRREPGMRQRLNHYCGGVPEWVQIINGEFCIRRFNVN